MLKDSGEVGKMEYDIYKFDIKSMKTYERDLIKFYFDIYEGGDSMSGRINFRAFLDSISDDYQGSWNKFNYAGRGEPFFTYDNFDRQIGFSFKIVAQSRHEMKPLYRKLNYLVSSTAPTYKDGRMRGTYAIITIGNLIRKVPGFFSSISLNWQKDYPWEITMDAPEDGLDTKGVSKMLELPHVLDVRCSFTPVHSFIPTTSITDSPFLVNGTTWISGKGAATAANGDLIPKPEIVEKDTTKKDTTNTGGSTNGGGDYIKNPNQQFSEDEFKEFY